jgi:hypothetical protein
VREGYQPLTVLSEESHFLGYDTAGRCFFLENNLCRLHKDHGLTHKPAICQLYPFNLVDTPAGLFVSLLFSCPSVLEGVGQLTTEHESGLEQLLKTPEGKVPQLPRIRQHILVTEYFTMTWECYLIIERQMLQSFDPNDPISCLIDWACQLVRPGLEQLDQKAPSGWLDAVKHQDMPLMASSVLVFLEDELDPEEAEGFLEQLREGMEPYSTRLQRPMPMVEVLRPGGELEREILARYVLNQIHGKLLLGGPSLVCRLLLVACALTVVLYDVRLGGQTASIDDLKRAFQVCEERLVAQSNDLEAAFQEFEELLVERYFTEV